MTITIWHASPASDQTVLVSACLLGVKCRYDGAAKPDTEIICKLSGMNVIPVCPEQLGGLPTPRPPAWIVGGDGFDVIEGRARVCVREPDRECTREVTREFLRGAEQCAFIAAQFNARRCYLKAKSPSCGLTPITGVAAAKLMLMGIEIIEIV